MISRIALRYVLPVVAIVALWVGYTTTIKKDAQNEVVQEIYTESFEDYHSTIKEIRRAQPTDRNTDNARERVRSWADRNR